MKPHLYSQMPTRLPKERMHRALLTYISMLCSQFNRCLPWAQHHWRHLKGTTGSMCRQLTNFSFQNSLTNSSSALTVASLASQLSLITNWHYFQMKRYLTHFSLQLTIWRVCINSRLFFFLSSFSFSDKMPKTLLFLHNTKLAQCIYVYASSTHQNLFHGSITTFSSPLIARKIRIVFFIEAIIKIYNIHYSSNPHLVLKQLQSFWTTLIFLCCRV